MASSRWKRFAFFDKHSLSVPPEVQEDLSLRTIQDDRIQLLVTTAGLPLESKPSTANSNNSSSSSTNNNNDHGDAVQAFWSSLIACSAQDLSAGSSEAQLLTLPRSSHGNSSSSSTTISSVADGLVLGWVTGSDTERVHCFDVTVRCNPPLAIEKDLEDLDGWRGYFAPFSLPAAAVVVGAPVSSPRPDHQHEKNISSSKNNSNNKVVAMAACREHVGSPLHVACVAEKQLVIWEDPHLHLSCRRPFKNQHDVVVSSDDTSNITNWRLQHAWGSNDGLATAVDIRPGMVAVGTSLGAVLIFCYSPSIINDNNKNASRISATLLQTQQLPRRGSIRPYLRIPPPPSDGLQVVSVNLVVEHQRASVFCAYRPQTVRSQSSTPTTSAVGVCCYDMALPSTSNTTLSAPSARHDLDGRIVGSSSLVDASTGQCITVARSDGLYSYSRTERTGVAPMDGTKLAFCFIPPTVGTAERMRRPLQQQTSSDAAGVGYALVASTDAKSGRDAVDIYDVMNKLVAFHLLLSPGHKAVRAAGLTTMPVNCVDGSMKHGRSSALVLTSGGSLITFTEKLTAEKISLLVQKNLYAAAIVIAYADPSFDSVDIAALFREHAEHLYRKGDYAGAMEQYIHTIGSLESSHVIFRYLDAPKIPLLVKYLEKFREQNLATPVHNELLRTCYLKLNDTEAADALTTAVSATLASTGDSSSLSLSSLSSILANLPENPRETLATICSFDAQHVAEILVVHGASLARVLPRETAGVVIALCVGTYSPKALAEASLIDAMSLNKMVERPNDDVHLMHQPYPVHLFTPAFIENPKMLRLILSHCNRNKCYLTPSLRRTLLEVTLDEWNQAKRNGDTELEKLRHKEAITVREELWVHLFAICERVSPQPHSFFYRLSRIATAAILETMMRLSWYTWLALKKANSCCMNDCR